LSGATVGKLMMKLSLTDDETPDLFRALAAVKDARRRTGRLKDLAAKGLLLERSGGATVGVLHVAAPAAHQAAGERPGEDPLRRHLPPGVTGSGLVSAWDEPAGDAGARKA
jgi:hypothetical protein